MTGNAFSKAAQKTDLINLATDKTNSGLVLWFGEVYQKEDMKQADNAYWRTAFTPALVALDTLIDGANEHIARIREDGYRVLVLTSRPESMRKATSDWLFDHIVGEIHDNSLIMKPVSQQYVKTVTWKTGVVELLVRLFGVDDLLFVDDEQAHCDSVEALDLPCDRIPCGSLQEAVISLTQMGVSKTALQRELGYDPEEAR